jgi:tRNA modification GTPase
LEGKKKGEDLIVCPISEQTIEIHCHGGDAAINAIRQALLSSGAAEIHSADSARLVSASRFNADLMMAIANATTRKTAKLLFAQQKAQARLVADLRQCMAKKAGDQAATLIANSLAWKQFGNHLVRPWTVVLCGHPNVGKSSLINDLAGFERAIVHSTAGTTRDILTQITAANGWPIELVDTAGLRDEADEIERAGIQLTQQQIAHADLVIAIFDASQEWTDRHHDLVRRFNPDLVVFNKSDIQPEPSGCSGRHVSAKTGDGIEALIDDIAETLVPVIPKTGQAIPVSARQVRCLEQALSLIRQERWADAAQMFD